MATNKQTARVRCTTAEPFANGMRYGFRAIESESADLGGVTLEILQVHKEGGPAYNPGDHFDVSLSPVPKTQTEDAAQAPIVEASDVLAVAAP